MGVQSPEIPGDEHLHQKLQKIYEKERSDKNPKNQQRQDIFSIAGITIFLLSLFMV